MISSRRAAAWLVLLASGSRMTAAEVDLAQHRSFADELTARLYENDNECTSALGASMAMSLIWPGTVGEAVDEIKDTLGYEGNNMQLVWEDTTEELVGSYDGRCIQEGWNGACDSAAPLLQIANSVWLDESNALNEDYDEVVGDLAKQIDFEAEDSPAIVNEWVSNSTNGLIDSIVDESKPLFPPYVLIAINSIYLKARWRDQFEEYLTNMDSFYASPTRDADESSDAHFMHTVEYFPYSHEVFPGYQVISLPFAASKMSMIFVLPMSDGSDAVSSADLIPELESLQNTRVALALPKFKFESEYDENLKEALFDAGIVGPFTEGSGALCGLFEDDINCEKLIIDKFIQKTVIELNEQGVEAAAVTAAMAVPTSIGPEDTNIPVEVILDHHFQFFIYDEEADVVLFEGQVGAPGIPEEDPDGPSVELMQGKHVDESFWSSRFGVDPVEPPMVSTSSTTSTTVTTTSTTTSEEDETTDATSTTAASEVGGATSGSEASLVPPPIDPMEHQQFADELTTLLYENANECSSALGVSMAFSLVWPGATEEGITEIRDTLGYPNGSNMRLVWEEATERMTTSYGGQCIDEWNGVCNAAAPLLEIAYSVWSHEEYDLNEEYDAVVGDYAKQIDFEADDSPVIVNEWVSESTNGLIESIVPEDKPLFPPYVLLAINSIYLKARWLEQFEKSNTNLDSFYASPSRNAEDVVADAHFMNTVEYFSYSHEAIPGYQIVDLPFAASDMSMIFVLPMNDDSEAVQSIALIEALGSLESARVALSLPKFQFESKYEDNLEESLIELGMQAPFTAGAEALCGIFEDDDLCPQLVIDKVIQKTFIDVNEEGVEAAAVTMIGVGLTSIMPDESPAIAMYLNCPFQFFIYDKSEELMLFEGRLGMPEVPDADPDVDLLDAKHSDEDFWSNRFGVDVVDPPSGAASTETSSTSATSTSTGATATTTTVEIIKSETSPTTNPTPSPATASDSPTSGPTKSPVSPSPPDSSTGPDNSSPNTNKSARIMKFLFLSSLWLCL